MCHRSLLFICLLTVCLVLGPVDRMLSTTIHIPSLFKPIPGYVRMTDREVLDGIVQKAGQITGEDLEGVDLVYRGLVGRGLDHVLSEGRHPFHDHDQIAGQESQMGSGRLRLPHLRTNRYHDIFTLQAIRLYDERVG